MERDSYLQGIRSAWLGELFGEAFFKAMAERTEDSAMRVKWHTLAQLEHVTGKRMAELLESHGEEATASDDIAVKEEVLSRYADASHQTP